MQKLKPSITEVRIVRRAFWRVLGIKARAAWRHPFNPKKRKAFQKSHIAEAFISGLTPDNHPPGNQISKLKLRLRAARRHPFNRKKRRRYFQEKKAVPFVTSRDIDVYYKPKVSVIIPNYNHSAFLDQRIESVLNQSYKNIEILILDDVSTDDSRAVIEGHVQSNENIRRLFNDTNSGNVFRQWRKGINNVSGDLIWICESDDFCDQAFLERLVPYFRDRSVTLAFGRIQFCGRDGKFQPGLDEYREGAEAEIWDRPVVRPAHQWFRRGFGVNNVIANVGGCLFRRTSLSNEKWQEAETYRVLGDWFLYSEIAAGGQIAYEPNAIAYFRQHGQNTSVSSFVRPSFYEEHYRLMLHFKKKWGVPNTTAGKFYKKVSWQYRHFNPEAPVSSLDALIDRPSILRQGRSQPHILIAFLGFHPGGGELFPINLANALHAEGHLVSLFALDANNSNAEMLAAVNTAIPIYTARWAEEFGVDRFIDQAGISLIHSHMVSLDDFFFSRHAIESMVPYLVTLHGSYEACNVTDVQMRPIIENVSHFIYTADKNLEPFKKWDVSPARFSKIRNAMPLDPRPFPETRSELGIANDAVVFSLVARGLKMKGWDESISAFLKLRAAHPSTKMHLLLCGTGEEVDRLSRIHKDDPNISFLGYQSCIHGLYRISDCAIVPTRFPGESFPLCIIQAMQTGTPVIGTRIGEIGPMIAPEGQEPGGLLIEYENDNNVFARNLADAMALMLDERKRTEFGSAAKSLGESYSMEELANTYSAIYGKLLSERGFLQDCPLEQNVKTAI